MLLSESDKIAFPMTVSLPRCDLRRPLRNHTGGRNVKPTRFRA
jgi:hypothetical protein